MPTYDYQCSACNKTYEARESFSAPMEHECQECGKGIAKRLLSAPTIVFKGSGWYVNDSRNKSGGSDDSTKTTSLPEAPKSEPSASTSSASDSSSSTSSSSASTAASST